MAPPWVGVVAATHSGAGVQARRHAPGAILTETMAATSDEQQRLEPCLTMAQHDPRAWTTSSLPTAPNGISARALMPSAQTGLTAHR